MLTEVEVYSITDGGNSAVVSPGAVITSLWVTTWTQAEVKEVITLVSAGARAVLVTALPSPTLVGGVDILVHKNLQHVLCQCLHRSREKTDDMLAATINTTSD